ncbi:MAG: diguanylate cyclase [Planctomycetaceae bacterium]|jgi:diguanylate cyclase (GGDEF)-like protein|nr:diguanylate cyclase [Planctomycetaceae bacterium]
MITLFILMPVVCLVMVTNIIAGCLLAIHFGYGPPDWKLGLNLVVRLSDLQNRCNAVRKLVNERYPVSEKYFTLLHIPNQISLVPVRKKVKSAEYDEADGSTAQHKTYAPIEDPVSESEMETSGIANAGREKADNDQIFFDKNLEAVLMDKGTKAWLINDKNIETALIKLNAVQMQSGLFVTKLDEKIRSLGSSVTKEDIVKLIEELQDDGKNYLASSNTTLAEIEQRINEFGEFQPKVEEMRSISQQQRLAVESALTGLHQITEASSPEVSAKMLLQELNSLRPARHKLRDMREQIFVRWASRTNKIGEIPKQLYADELSGLRGRIGLEVVLADWQQQKHNESKNYALALFDFVKFGDANKKYGIAVCDKIIRHFGQKLKEQFAADDVTGIYSGNCFMSASHQLSLEKLTEKVERIRQHCEKTVFKPAGRDVKIILQMTAAAVQPAETLEATLSALEAALQAAKQDGKNRMYVCPDGGLPAKAEGKDYHESPSEIVLE